MRLIQFPKLRSAKFRELTMKLIFTLCLILHTVHASLDRIYEQFGYITSGEKRDAQLRIRNYNTGHFVFERWLKKSAFGQIPNPDFCAKCDGTCCAPPSPDDPPLQVNVPRTKLCDPPEGDDPSWGETKEKLFDCLCNPEMQLSDKWHTDVLESLRDKMRNAFNMEIPNAQEVGRYQFRACALEHLISEPFEIPQIFKCSLFGQQELSVAEDKIVEWVRMDMPMKKRIFELETMPCYAEPIAHMANAVLKYYSTRDIEPPAVDIDPETGIATLKQPFSLLKDGDEVLIDIRDISEADLLISAVIELEHLSKDPKFMGYMIDGEEIHIYSASMKNVNFVSPQVESLHQRGKLQELCYDGVMVPAESIAPLRLFERPEMLTVFLKELQETLEKENMEKEDLDRLILDGETPFFGEESDEEFIPRPRKVSGQAVRKKSDGQNSSMIYFDTN